MCFYNLLYFVYFIIAVTFIQVFYFAKKMDTHTLILYVDSSPVLLSEVHLLTGLDSEGLAQLSLGGSKSGYTIKLTTITPNSDVCLSYIPASESNVYNHVLYDYPAVTDPGIVEALLRPEKETSYPEDGFLLYKKLCQELNTQPIGLFYRDLLKNEINLSYYCVSSKGIQAIAKALERNRHVQSLNLAENFLDGDACFHLGKMLGTNAYIEDLVLTGCKIGPSGLTQLMDNMYHNGTLTKLNLTRNCLGDEGGVIIGKAILNGASISQLNLSKNNLGSATIEMFIEVLGQRNYLTHLDFSWNQFVKTSILVEMLARLSCSSKLEELNLSWTNLVGTKIANALAFVVLIPTLRVLNLSHNKLHGGAIQMIIIGLPKAKALRTLDLSGNPLSTNDTLVVISKMLRPRVKLENLYLDHIFIDKQFLTVLERVQKLKCRKDFKVTYGDLVENWSLQEPDLRELVLRRAAAIGIKKKDKVDVPLYLVKLCEEYGSTSMPVDVLKRKMHQDGFTLDEHLLTEIAHAFPGPKIKKTPTLNFSLLREFLSRMYPEKKLPENPFDKYWIKYHVKKPIVKKRNTTPKPFFTRK